MDDDDDDVLVHVRIASALLCFALLPFTSARQWLVAASDYSRDRIYLTVTDAINIIIC